MAIADGGCKRPGRVAGAGEALWIQDGGGRHEWWRGTGGRLGELLRGEGQLGAVVGAVLGAGLDAVLGAGLGAGLGAAPIIE